MNPKLKTKLLEIVLEKAWCDDKDFNVFDDSCANVYNAYA